MDVSLFAQFPPLHEVHIQVVSQTARPPAIILLSGELYHSLVLVSAVCVSDEDYGFSYNGFDALSHIKLVAKVEGCPERYNPLLYFLVATAQGLNPSKSGLDEISLASHADGNMRQKLSDRRKASLQYQLQDLATEGEVVPPTEPVVTTHQETADVTDRVSRSGNSRSISYAATTQGRGNVPERNQN